MKPSQCLHHGLLVHLKVALAFLPFFVAANSFAMDSDTQVINVELGDYRFTPSEIEIPAGSTVLLQLTNTDGVVPHNFSLKDEAAGLDIDVNLSAGSIQSVEITPMKPGSYRFYCDKKLPFMKSHRQRGMEGTLTVTTAHPE